MKICSSLTEVQQYQFYDDSLSIDTLRRGVNQQTAVGKFGQQDGGDVFLALQLRESYAFGRLNFDGDIRAGLKLFNRRSDDVFLNFIGFVDKGYLDHDVSPRIKCERKQSRCNWNLHVVGVGGHGSTGNEIRHRELLPVCSDCGASHCGEQSRICRVTEGARSLKLDKNMIAPKTVCASEACAGKASAVFQMPIFGFFVWGGFLNERRFLDGKRSLNAENT